MCNNKQLQCAQFAIDQLISFKILVKLNKTNIFVSKLNFMPKKCKAIGRVFEWYKKFCDGWDDDNLYGSSFFSYKTDFLLKEIFFCNYTDCCFLMWDEHAPHCGWTCLDSFSLFLSHAFYP